MNRISLLMTDHNFPEICQWRLLLIATVAHRITLSNEEKRAQGEVYLVIGR